MSQGKRPNPGWSDAAGAPLNNPFAALAGRVTAPEAAPHRPDDAASPSAPSLQPPARAVVRFERKGRGGKAVTVISHLGVPSAELDRLCAEARKKLGCGGVVEDDAVVLQGDQRDRAVAWLTGLGVRKVTTSG